MTWPLRDPRGISFIDGQFCTQFSGLEGRIICPTIEARTIFKKSVVWLTVHLRDEDLTYLSEGESAWRTINALFTDFAAKKEGKVQLCVAQTNFQIPLKAGEEFCEKAIELVREMLVLLGISYQWRAYNLTNFELQRRTLIMSGRYKCLPYDSYLRIKMSLGPAGVINLEPKYHF